ncbi:hypothetical protein BSG1_02240 [Bacillus sp. SG-1]|nr:hypothetical protein BSG1_02240 [Bacillus sp. SG-1]
MQKNPKKVFLKAECLLFEQESFLKNGHTYPIRNEFNFAHMLWHFSFFVG